ncbi:MAG: DUF296 domain-containing protein [Candidatus Harrisonbacteria bacterium CG10_big_fil_rev_8_21_14_0_10_49_15]|uniref:DUF296 domain-containing protein n=1 Tax=Candidatus Harrisonbacteria bacterium CG10_big_fil_rev_8_21_14_0_10_49_15 TaxID=1974587 RepID=A0A2H0UKP3_9BACT|nr:MAG: DUF296 domain-containing protein [Candidatus Harrisonbacteria bacterium CG10_big_fil_rev_8_21_14_0_10_49_15]
MKQITKRLLPGQDLRAEIEKIVKEQEIKAGVILSGVGSLTNLRLRMAGAKEVKEWSGEFEIVSITGTLSQADCHLHLSASNPEGTVIGGHLKQGCIIGTTCELVLMIFEEVEYKRAPDPSTGYDELEVCE